MTKQRETTMPPYIQPSAVTSPRLHWALIAVLADNGPEDISLAVGRWDGAPVLAMRWNGDNKGNPIGSPQSRGLSTWFILPEGKYTEAIIGTLGADQRTLVRNFIPAP